MSVVQKQVNIVSSVDNFLAIVVAIMSDVKAKKPAATVVADAVPALIGALTGIADLKADLMDHKDLETTVALKLSEISNVLVG